MLAIHAITFGSMPHLTLFAGAPEILLGECTTYIDGSGKVAPMTVEVRASIEEAIGAMADNGALCIASLIPLVVAFVRAFFTQQAVCLLAAGISLHALTFCDFATPTSNALLLDLLLKSSVIWLDCATPFI